MNISISNIAWNPDEDAAVADLLVRSGVALIDIAPSKYFPAPAEASDADISAVRRWWAERGISVAGMQSLLFGTQGLNVFADAGTQQRLLDHLRHVFRIGAALGATRLVFGSPRNRDRGDLSDEAANTAGADFFHRAGVLARSEGVTLCLEPNPARYGANFMTSTSATAEVVARVGHANVKMQLDTGAILINGEDPKDILPRYAPLIGHVHLSEPDLVALGSSGASHEHLAVLLNQYLEASPFTIEMLRPDEGLPAIDRALAFVLARYRRSPGSAYP